MNSANMLGRQSHRLLQIGVALLLFSSCEGFVFPNLAAPRLGLSAHTLSALQAVLSLALGLVWPGLIFGRATSRNTRPDLSRTRPPASL